MIVEHIRRIFPIDIALWFAIFLANTAPTISPDTRNATMMLLGITKVANPITWCKGINSKT